MAPRPGEIAIQRPQPLRLRHRAHWSGGLRFSSNGEDSRGGDSVPSPAGTGRWRLALVRRRRRPGRPRGALASPELSRAAVTGE